MRCVAETETAVREAAAVPEMDPYEAQVVGMVKQTIAKAGDKIPKVEQSACRAAYHYKFKSKISLQQRLIN